MKRQAEFAGLSFVNSNTFYNVQRTLIVPTINKQFDENIKLARDEAKQQELVIYIRRWQV